MNEAHGNPVWKNNETTRDKIRKLNQRHTGPITFPRGKGKQPNVDKAALAAWWSRLSEHYDARIETENDDAESTELTVAESHKYGMSGKVVPGIGGYEKHPRTDKGKKGKERKR